MSFSEAFLENLVEQVYRRPLDSLLPTAGIYRTDPLKLGLLRAELYKWRQLQSCGANARLSIISRREESLALAILDVLHDVEDAGTRGLTRASEATARALEVIHSSELETISAAELCKYTSCSQRTLEKIFLARFGVTPKKYVKFLRLAQVHRGLRNFESQGCNSIIELASIHGFWHMGQLAADYRRTYGELPSDTLSRC